MTTGHVVLILVIYMLACARVTKLVNSDMVTDPIRLWVARRASDKEHPDASAAERRRWGVLLYWLGCPWCVGMWVCLAAAILPVELAGWPAWTLIPVGLAASYTVGLMASLAESEDVDIEED